MTPLILSLAIPVVVLLIARVCYCWGFVSATQQLEHLRVQHIKTVHHAWRAGMLAERMRQFSPKDVSKN